MPSLAISVAPAICGVEGCLPENGIFRIHRLLPEYIKTSTGNTLFHKCFFKCVALDKSAATEINQTAPGFICVKAISPMRQWVSCVSGIASTT